MGGEARCKPHNSGSNAAGITWKLHLLFPLIPARTSPAVQSYHQCKRLRSWSLLRHTVLDFNSTLLVLTSTNFQSTTAAIQCALDIGRYTTRQTTT